MKAFALILLFCPLTLFATSINLAGIVPERVDFSLDSGLKITSNGDFMVEILKSSGQKERHFLQYNQGVDLKNRELKKVIIYAP